MSTPKKENTPTTTAKTIEVNGKTVTVSATAVAPAMDWERDYKNTVAEVTGVRYARIDDSGRVLQVRFNLDELPHWVTVKDAVSSGLLPEKYDSFKGGYTEYAAKIARVELMEELGLEIPDGVAVAYAAGLEEKKKADKAREDKEDAIVKAGKDAYVKDAGAKAGKRFDKIEERVNARQK